MAPTARARNLDPHARELLAAVVIDARFMAELTAGFLTAIGLIPPPGRPRREPVGLPAGFLLELAAALRIAIWERAGLKDRLGIEYPPARRAIAEIFDRYTAGEQGPPAGDYADVVMEVFKATHSRLARAGRVELGVDVAIDEPDDELLLVALAEFLWTNRDAGTLRG